MAVVPASLAHRAAWSLPVDWPVRLVLADVGGAEGAQAIADRLYDGIEGDRPLRQKFGGDLDGERHKLGALLIEMLGGEPIWSQRYARGDLAGAHRFIHITSADAGQWLGHARQAAVEVAGVAVAARLVKALRPLAFALVNEVEPAPRDALREARYAPTRQAIRACERGDVDGLVALLDASPHLTEPADPGSAELTVSAARRGRVEVLRLLLDRGAHVNKPGRTAATGLLVTPLAAARAARKRAAADLLVAAGAVDDVFTAAYVGDADGVRNAIKVDPALANAVDPASDLFGATVVDHAALGADPDAVLPVLAAFSSRAPSHAHQLLWVAADQGRVEVVRTLLELGADARFVSPGRWVLNRACAELLWAAGADVNHAPTRWESWVWRACTGNKGAKDDPDFVAALLAVGADVHTRVFDKTALHFAAKAGFAETVALLLQAGADPDARDADGLTPMWHLLRSGPRADRARVARLLTDAGADLSITDAKGRTLEAMVAADGRRPPAERNELLSLLRR